MSREPMALKTIKKVNLKLKFLHRKNRFLTLEPQQLFCNAVKEPHFDYAWSGWYPNLTQKLKKGASNYAKQMYSLFPSIGQNVPNFS